MSLLARRCLNRSHQLEEYVETWQIDHKDSVYAHDLEELVKECLELTPLLRRAWDSTVERLFDETARSDRVFTGEEVIRGAISRALKVFLRVAQLLEAAERAGFSIENAAGFKDGRHALEQLERDAEKEWPPLDSGQITDSLEAYKRGDFKSAEDMLGELQGSSTRAD